MASSGVDSFPAAAQDTPELVCRHCRSPLPQRASGDGSDASVSTGFCCHGCHGAWHLIRNLNLSEFYSLVQGAAIEKARDQRDTLVELFDDAEFRQQFCCEVPGPRVSASLSIEGLTCYACVWLIREAVARNFPGVEVSISLSSGVAQVAFEPARARLSQVVQLIRGLGYAVSPRLSRNSRPHVEDLVRIGVNAFCVMNVMLLALPEYVDPDMARDFGFWHLFRILSLVLTAVSLTWGAWPFYRNSWQYIRQGRISIDLPIVFALVVTFVYSAVNTIRAQGDVYFDSVCVVITLLTLSRYLQKRMMARAEAKVMGRYDHTMQYVKKLVRDGNAADAAAGGQREIVPIFRLQKGDGFVVLPGDLVPVRAEVTKGSGEVQYEQMTGETDPVAVTKGSMVEGGAVNLSMPLELTALEDGAASFVVRFNKILAEILLERGRYTRISDRLGTTFFGLVMVIAAVILVNTWSISPEEALQRTVAALLIACPCAFAVAVPLTMTVCAALGFERGVVFRSQKAIETLGRVRSVFFDKSGTLTAGSPGVIRAQVGDEGASGLSAGTMLGVLGELDQFSEHHVIRAVAAWARGQSQAGRGAGGGAGGVSAVRESFGQGLAFDAAGWSWRIGRQDFCNGDDDGHGQPDRAQAQVELAVARTPAEGFRVVARFDLEDPVGPDSARTISWLQGRGIAVGVISGDFEERTQTIAHQLGVPEHMVWARQTPESKQLSLRSAVQGGGPVAMVGNGFNDSLALADADVGVVVNDANQQAKSAADVCLVTPGVSALATAIEISRRTLQKIHQSYIFAVTFNLIGLLLAATGHLSPVVAAVLMPISSVTVITIAVRWSVPVKA